MLEDAEKDCYEGIVSWLPHGKAFRVHKQEEFVHCVMPRYFMQTKYKSFQRQLHIYGFHRALKGIDKGAYCHEKFVRTDRTSCLRMVRQRRKRIGKEEEKEQDQRCTTYASDSLFSPLSPVPEVSSSLKPVDADHENNGNTSGTGSGALTKSFLPDVDCNRCVSRSCQNSDVFRREFRSELFQDGDEIFFEGKRFYFVEEKEDTYVAGIKCAPFSKWARCA